MSIRLQDVTVVYGAGTAFATTALKNITCTILRGDITGLIGPTGSGKSTLLQLLNGLLRPTSGKILVNGVPIQSLKGRDLVQLRRAVGLVFQFPERQIFETTVKDEVAFGPRQTGLAGKELEERVAWAMEQVGLLPADFGHRRCASLSGGQKRLLAIAGVLAMKPDYLLLDEPWAGIDAVGRRCLKQTLLRLKNQGAGVVLVSHDMEDLAEISDRLIVLNEGRLMYEGTVREVLKHSEELIASGVGVPVWNRILVGLKRLCPEICVAATTVEEAAEEVERMRQVLASRREEKPGAADILGKVGSEE